MRMEEELKKRAFVRIIERKGERREEEEDEGLEDASMSSSVGVLTENDSIAKTMTDMDRSTAVTDTSQGTDTPQRRSAGGDSSNVDEVRSKGGRVTLSESPPLPPPPPLMTGHPFWRVATVESIRGGGGGDGLGSSNGDRAVKSQSSRMMTYRRTLPAWTSKGEFLNLMNNNKVGTMTYEDFLMIN